MRSFRDGHLDILVSTPVVEVGIDVPNASVMLVEGADRFGLAQLHQFRGRVGRGPHQSYCLLLADDPGDEAKKRLEAVSGISRTASTWPRSTWNCAVQGTSSAPARAVSPYCTWPVSLTATCFPLPVSMQPQFWNRTPPSNLRRTGCWQARSRGSCRKPWRIPLDHPHPLTRAYRRSIIYPKEHCALTPPGPLSLLCSLGREGVPLVTPEATLDLEKGPAQQAEMNENERKW